MATKKKTNKKARAKKPKAKKAQAKTSKKSSAKTSAKNSKKPARKKSLQPRSVASRNRSAGRAAKPKAASKNRSSESKEIRNSKASRPQRPQRPIVDEDLQGLSQVESADSESVSELVDEGNTFEAGAVEGVERADDSDGKEVRTREFAEDDVPEEYLDEE